MLGVSESGLILYQLGTDTNEGIGEDTRRVLMIISADGERRATISCDAECDKDWNMEGSDAPLPDRERALINGVDAPKSFSDLAAQIGRALRVTPPVPSTIPLRVRNKPEEGTCAVLDVVEPEGPLTLMNIAGSGCHETRAQLLEHPRSGFLFVRIRHEGDHLTIEDDRWIPASVLGGLRLVRQAGEEQRRRRPARAIPLAKQALALVPESHEARWILANAMADAGYAWTSARAELDVAYPAHHDCTLMEGPTGFFSWLSQRSPWAVAAAGDPWFEEALRAHGASHDPLTADDLLYLPETRLPPWEAEPATEEAPETEPSADSPEKALQADASAAPSSDQAGARLFLGGLPIAFDLGSILVVAAHLVILGSVVLARRAARERPS